MNYFSCCIKLEHVRPRYKELALQYHPDRPCGDTEIMKEVNRQYHAKLESFHGTKLYNAKTKEEYSYKYDYRKESALAEKIDAVIALKLDNINLLVVGNWIWIEGTTKEQASLFNKQGIGFLWSAPQKRWYWSQSAQYGKTKRSGMSFEQIKDRHGSQDIEHERTTQLN